MCYSDRNGLSTGLSTATVQFHFSAPYHAVCHTKEPGMDPEAGENSMSCSITSTWPRIMLTGWWF